VSRKEEIAVATGCQGEDGPYERGENRTSDSALSYREEAGNKGIPKVLVDKGKAPRAHGRDRKN